jgi:WD40 repeat protein
MGLLVTSSIFFRDTIIIHKIIKPSWHHQELYNERRNPLLKDITMAGQRLSAIQRHIREILGPATANGETDGQGKTNEEAARHLHWPAGTVKTRLAGARSLLQTRLIRRGCTLSTAGLAMVLEESRTIAAVPGSLVASTVKNATFLTAVETAIAGGLSGQVAALMEGMVRAVFVARVKFAAAVLLAAVVVAAGAVFAIRQAVAAKHGDETLMEQPFAEGREDPQAKPEGKKLTRTDLSGDPLPPGAGSRLGTLRFRHGARVYRAVFSPDGKQLATSAGESICLWEAITGKERRRWLTIHGAVLAFSPDGKVLAIDNSSDPQNGKIRLLDVATGEEVRQLEVHTAGVRSVAFAPDGKVLALCAYDKIVRLWDPATGQELRLLEGHQKHVSAVAFGPDGKILASGSDDQTIRLWDVATGKELGRLTGHEGAVHSVAFAPDGATLASGGDDKTIRIWDVAKRQEIRVLGSHAAAVHMVAFSPDGKFLATSGDTIAIWDVGSGKELRRWKPPVFSLALGGFSPDSKTLASVAFPECAPRLWDVATGREVGLLGGHRSSIYWLAFARDGKTLTSSEREKVRVLRWDLATGRDLEIFSLAVRKVIRSSLSPDGKTLATWERAVGGGSVRLWDPAAGKELHLLGQHKWESSRAEAPWRPLAFSPDGKHLASVDHERIILWDIATGQMVREFLGLRGEIHCVAFSPGGLALAAGIRGGGDRSILLWDTATGKELYACGQGESVSSLAFSPDAKLLASANEIESVRLWDVATGKIRFTFTGPEKGVYALSFSPDGKTLAGAGPGQENAIWIWEVFTGQEVCRFVGDKAVALCLAFAPDGRTLASGNTDSTILLWNLPGCKKTGPSQPVQLSAAKLERVWDDLGGKAAKAYEAIGILVSAPGQAVPLIQARQPPVSPVDPQQIKKLIVALNSDRFTVREQADADLEKLGELAVPALRKNLAAQPALDVRRRLERLLEKLDGTVTSPDRLRGLRAIAVLEQIGDRDARQLLDKLAHGTPDSRLTQEAKASLERLAKRTAATP